MRATVDPRLHLGRDRVGHWASTDRDGHNGRFVVDGPLFRQLLIIGSDGAGWTADGMPGEPWEHVSVSVLGRHVTPTWAEMDFVKNLFWGEDETVVQLHVPKADHISLHPGCLHLWRPASGWPLLPPKECV